MTSLSLRQTPLNTASFRALWPVAAALVSVAMLGAAHAFESIGGYAPCTLCLRQREVYWAALTIALIGMVLARLKRLGLGPLALMLGATFLAGAIVATYHAGTEWKFWPGPTTCSGAGLGGGAIDASSISSLLNGAKIRPPACDEAAWRMFGISMAGYNALISLGLAGLGFAAAFVPDPKR